MGMPNDKIPNEILKIIDKLSMEDAKELFIYIRGIQDEANHYWEVAMGEDI